MDDFFYRHDGIVSPILGAVLVVVILLVRRSIRLNRERLRARTVAAGLPEPPELRSLPWKRGLLAGAGLAAFYLLIFRLLTLAPPYSLSGKGGPILMSFAFLFLGPFVAGIVTVAQGTREEPWPISAWILAPWIPIFANIILAISIRWEGIICAIFILPAAMVSSSLGGVLAGGLQRHWHRKSTRTTLYCFAALPLLLAMTEATLNQPLQTRTVYTSAVIHAPPDVVWTNIERVPPISPSELSFSWATAIGFPRPIEATLSFPGVGGVRHASFERGLTFTETITDWVPNQRLRFTIRANTDTIPPTTLDQHVTIGGRFFDVLTGEYELQPQANGDTLLILTSRERLSTDFNAYAAMWSDAVMRSIQTDILQVIQHRCERVNLK